jgi:hypothetical protein
MERKCSKRRMEGEIRKTEYESRKYPKPIHTCIHTYTCTHTQWHTYRQTDRQTYEVHTYIHTYIHTHTYTHTHTHMHMHICTHARMHIHKHKCKVTHRIAFGHHTPARFGETLDIQTSYILGFQSSGMWHCITGFMFPDVLWNIKNHSPSNIASHPSYHCGNHKTLSYFIRSSQ